MFDPKALDTATTIILSVGGDDGLKVVQTMRAAQTALRDEDLLTAFTKYIDVYCLLANIIGKQEVEVQSLRSGSKPS